MDGDDWLSDEKELCMKLTLVSKPGKLLRGLWKCSVLAIIEKESMGLLFESSLSEFVMLWAVRLLLLYWLSTIISSDELIFENYVD